MAEPIGGSEGEPAPVRPLHKREIAHQVLTHFFRDRRDALTSDVMDEMVSAVVENLPANTNEDEVKKSLALQLEEANSHTILIERLSELDIQDHKFVIDLILRMMSAHPELLNKENKRQLVKIILKIDTSFIAATYNLNERKTIGALILSAACLGTKVSWDRLGTTVTRWIQITQDPQIQKELLIFQFPKCKYIIEKMTTLNSSSFERVCSILLATGIKYSNFPNKSMEKSFELLCFKFNRLNDTEIETALKLMREISNNEHALAYFQKLNQSSIRPFTNLYITKLKMQGVDEEILQHISHNVIKKDLKSGFLIEPFIKTLSNICRIKVLDQNQKSFILRNIIKYISIEKQVKQKRSTSVVIEIDPEKLNNAANIIELCINTNRPHLLTPQFFAENKIVHITDIKKQFYDLIGVGDGDPNLIDIRSFEETFDSRTQMSLLIYASNTKLRWQNENLSKYQILDREIRHYVKSVVKGTFAKERAKNNPLHLQQFTQAEQMAWTNSLQLDLENILVKDTVDPQDLLRCGEGNGSCQSVNNKVYGYCLLGYVWDPQVRMIEVVDKETGSMIARSMMRILKDEKTGKAVIVLEPIYPQLHSYDSKRLILNMAITKARSLGCSLYVGTGFSPFHMEMDDEPEVSLLSKGGPMDQYVDSLGQNDGSHEKKPGEEYRVTGGVKRVYTTGPAFDRQDDIA